MNLCLELNDRNGILGVVLWDSVRGASVFAGDSQGSRYGYSCFELLIESSSYYLWLIKIQYYSARVLCFTSPHQELLLCGKGLLRCSGLVANGTQC